MVFTIKWVGHSCKVSHHFCDENCRYICGERGGNQLTTEKQHPVETVIWLLMSSVCVLWKHVKTTYSIWISLESLPCHDLRCFFPICRWFTYWTWSSIPWQTVRSPEGSRFSASDQPRCPPVISHETGSRFFPVEFDDFPARNLTN